MRETFSKARKGNMGFHGDASEKTRLTRVAVNTRKARMKSARVRNTDRSLTSGLLQEDSEPFEEWNDTLARAVTFLPRKLKEVTRL